MQGKVAPMQMHHGRMETANTRAERTRYPTELVWPAPRRYRSPKAKSAGTAKAPAPISNSAAPYRTIAERPAFCTQPAIDRPANHAPIDNPSMKTDKTTESTGVMIPNDANASRVQTTS